MTEKEARNKMCPINNGSLCCARECMAWDVGGCRLIDSNQRVAEAIGELVDLLMSKL